MKLSKETQVWLLTSLEALKAGNISLPRSGICDNLKFQKTAFPMADRMCAIRWMQKSWRQWKHFSGDFAFPVPSCVSYMGPERCYLSGMPMWRGKYGKLRKDLLDFLITTLKKEMKQ